HNIVKIVSIDKDKKDMQLEFSIKRYDKDWQLIFQHSFSRSWSAFKNEFSRISSVEEIGKNLMSD
ncbi:MAG: hypothetical protein Q6370_023880, partial [Candidatus Sigynarchaeota archaeon]